MDTQPDVAVLAWSPTDGLTLRGDFRPYPEFRQHLKADSGLKWRWSGRQQCWYVQRSHDWGASHTEADLQMLAAHWSERYGIDVEVVFGSKLVADETWSATAAAIAASHPCVRGITAPASPTVRPLVLQPGLQLADGGYGGHAWKGACYDEVATLPVAKISQHIRDDIRHAQTVGWMGQSTCGKLPSKVPATGTPFRISVQTLNRSQICIEVHDWDSPFELDEPRTGQHVEAIDRYIEAEAAAVLSVLRRIANQYQFSDVNSQIDHFNRKFSLSVRMAWKDCYPYHEAIEQHSDSSLQQ